MAERAFIGLGSNLGDRHHNLRAALDCLKQRGLSVSRVSRVFETAPVGPISAQPSFLNAVAEAWTADAPLRLLQLLLEVEEALGRTRKLEMGPRLIDLDLLLMGEHLVDSAALTLPHPELHRRAFVLVPLLELEPDLSDPRTGQRFAQCLSEVGAQEIWPVGTVP